MLRVRNSHRGTRYQRLFEYIRQGNLANAMTDRPATHEDASTSDMLVFQMAAARSLQAD